MTAHALDQPGTIKVTDKLSTKSLTRDVNFTVTAG